ncbi:MAG: SDR family NAD(P)-dependent oxidoreductase [Nitriliruptorales bacterium]|nr:SDR family NAD(P)-dependent oxidoreductase [Nitriliruptorales bacterium]
MPRGAADGVLGGSLVTTLDPRGKVAVVTGASAGIGHATARALANAGATVVATARRTEKLDQLASTHDAIAPYTADVTDMAAVEGLAAWVRDQYGACHILVNNAGASFGGRLLRGADVAAFERTIDLNLMGVVRCMTAFADLLFSAAPGRVVNIASVAGKLGFGPAAYVASKFALVGLTEAAGWDWRRKGVTVSQVNPGFIRTEQFPQDELMKSAWGRRLVGTPERVADVIVDVVRHGHPERTVPRWYRAGVVLRHVAAPVYWSVGGKGSRRL